MFPRINAVPSRDFTSLKEKIDTGGKTATLRPFKVTKRLNIMATLGVGLHLQQGNDLRSR
jgi:hypothetical protein